MRRSSAETREHVLATAHETFYWQGIKGTGVDKVAADAGVAPTTLYRLFASKDDLVAAYVQRADRLYRIWFDEAVGSGGSDPADRILAVFDHLRHQVRPGNFRGCPFLMALSEYAEPGHPVHKAAVATKTWVRGRFADLVADLAAARSLAYDAAGTADRLALVMEGVYASAQALGTGGPAAEARGLVETLIQAAPATRTRKPSRRAGRQ